MRILRGNLEDPNLQSSRILLNLAKILEDPATILKDPAMILKDPAMILGDPATIFEDLVKILEFIAKIHNDPCAGSCAGSKRFYRIHSRILSNKRILDGSCQ